MLDGFRKLSWLVFLSGIVLLPATVLAGEPLLTFGAGFEFTSGDYGTATRTNSVYAPVTIGFNPSDRLGLSLEIPYVYQSNTNVIAGQFRQMQGQQMGMQSVAGAMAGPGSGAGMGNNSLRSSANSDPSKAQSGIGDIILKAGYVLFQESDFLPQVRPAVSVKVPTADKNKGLGTGEFDEGVSVELSKWFGDWYTFLEPGYTIQGKSADLSLKNYVSCNGGFGYQVTDNFRPMLIIKGSSALADGLTELLEARLKLKYQATPHTGIEGYLAKGITTSSPDYGTGIAVFYDF
ncbi:transporter [Geobacter pelophilus]|uniref:Transporter n=1 Tax=Geoanaerobacter pelophilus TaxID=60036 RepID=A0AAW4L245_9BACT|nr:transporter [Geoanaerobacter pelophilus]